VRFQKTPLLKPFSKVSVFISVFGRFKVDDRRKRIKKYAFSNENTLVWTGENKTKTLVWAKIFCFVLGPIHANAFSLKTHAFWCVFAYRPHENVWKRWRKRRLSKTVSKVESFENASFWKRSVSNVDRWKQRLLKTVTKNASYTGASINVLKLAENVSMSFLNSGSSSLFIFHMIFHTFICISSLSFSDAVQ
jgi:hypothetical protein